MILCWPDIRLLLLPDTGYPVRPDIGYLAKYMICLNRQKDFQPVPLFMYYPGLLRQIMQTNNYLFFLTLFSILFLHGHNRDNEVNSDLP